MSRLVSLALVAITVAAAPAGAQDYRWQELPELGVKFRLYKKLKQIPVQIGASASYLKARFETYSPGDYIWGRYGAHKWELKVYAWDKAPAAGAPKTGNKDDKSKTIRVPGRSHKRFEDFVKDKSADGYNKRKFRVEGKEYNKNRGRPKLPYVFWEYTDQEPMTNGYERFDQLWIKKAAIYDVGGKQVAFVIDMPAKHKELDERAIKRSRLQPKHRKWAESMILSVSPLKDSGGDDSDSDKADPRDRFANTPERQKALDKAKANIAGLKNWDYFTTESYIILYSWPPNKSRAAKPKYYKAARDIAGDMDHMRKLYEEYYPPHQKMKMPYSILRICSTYSEFSKYGSTSGGVVGWFSPATKELVMFHNKRIEKPVAFHEGWHQYADSYFVGARLHRWFDEGTGDFFGSHERKGRRWGYETSAMRKAGIKATVRAREYVPLNEIVTWNKDKFYGANAVKYYEQGYAMVDFLRNGKRSRGWNDDWNDVLDKYRKVMLETKDQEKAVKAAFENVDWDEFTAAWEKWVKAY